MISVNPAVYFYFFSPSLRKFKLPGMRSCMSGKMLWWPMTRRWTQTKMILSWCWDGCVAWKHLVNGKRGKLCLSVPWMLSFRCTFFGWIPIYSCLLEYLCGISFCSLKSELVITFLGLLGLAIWSAKVSLEENLQSYNQVNPIYNRERHCR